MSLREKILTRRPVRKELVACPEWECDVWVKAVKGRERDEYEAGLYDGDGKRNIANMRARLCVIACVDDDGKPVFTASDVAELGEQDAAPLDRCFQAAKRLAGIGEDEVAKKNSKETPSDASPSA